MKEIHTIREKRYGEHIKKTLQPAKAVKRLTEIQKARKQVHLIRAPVANRQKAKEPEAEKQEEMEVN